MLADFAPVRNGPNLIFGPPPHPQWDGWNECGVFRYPIGIPPQMRPKASELLGKLAVSRGPDRRQSGPRQSGLFISQFSGLTRIWGGIPIGCRFTPHTILSPRTIKMFPNWRLDSRPNLCHPCRGRRFHGVDLRRGCGHANLPKGRVAGVPLGRLYGCSPDPTAS
jgi:hypothetical protein